MSRSSKKGHYVDQKLLEKIRKFSNLKNFDVQDSNASQEQESNISNSSSSSKSKKIGKKNQQQVANSGSFKTWSRSSVVHPEMIGKNLLIHNGKEHKDVLITSSMVGLKLGSLSPTRKRGIHGKAGKH